VRVLRLKSGRQSVQDGLAVQGPTSACAAHGKIVLYPYGNCALPPWRDFLAVTDYRPATSQRLSPKGKPLSVLAAIPAFNEGPTIGSVVLRAKQYADEVVVVDDGSTDDTAEIASLAGAHVIHHAKNLGKGTAIRSAWLFARERHPQVLVLLDGDHQHDPRDIPRVAEPILTGLADVALGVRWGKTSGMPFHRRVGKRVLDYATLASVRRGTLTDSQSGYRAFSYEAVVQMEPTERGLAIESQLLIDAQERNLRIQNVEIAARYDLDGSTFPPTRHGMSVLGRIIILLTERRPLFFFSLPGFGLLVLAAALAIITEELYYSSGVFAIGYAFLVLLFAIIGVISVFIGIVLNAMKRIIERVRPEIREER